MLDKLLTEAIMFLLFKAIPVFAVVSTIVDFLYKRAKYTRE